jgi:hypothetical protein
LFASDADLDINEVDDIYDCANCPVADALSDLHDDPANAEAWELFKRTMSRFTVDTHTVGLVLDRLDTDITAQTFPDLVERFAIIYDALHPPQKDVNGS